MNASTRRLLLVCLVAALATCFGPAAVRPVSADDPAASPEPTDRTIYIPFKNLKDVLQQKAATALVPYADYLKYLEFLRTGGGPQLPVNAAITSAQYRGVVEEDLVRITAEYSVKVLDKPWVEIPLAFGDAAVGKVTGSAENVVLRGTGEGTYGLLLGTPGEQTVTIELVARIRTTPEGREFTLAVPTVGITTLELTIPEADQTVTVAPRLVTLANAADAPAGSTRVTVSLGSTKSITARWHSKASLKPEMELLASVNNRQLVTVDGGLVHHDAWLTYDVLRGQLESLKIAVPLGHRILDVTADARIRRWQAEEAAGRQVVTVELLSPVEKAVTVEVHTERASEPGAEPVAGLTADGAAYGIHALEAVRESGQVAIRVGDDLELTVAEQQGVTRISGAEIDPHLKSGAATAFKFYGPQFRLAVSARPIEPRVLVTQSSQVIFDEDEVRLEAVLNYQVERAGVFELALLAPADLIIDDVQSPQMQDELFDAATRTLRVRLPQKTTGAIEVHVRAHRAFTAGADGVELDLPVLEPLNVARETGTVQVFAPPGIEVVTDEAGRQSVQPAPSPGRLQAGAATLTSAWTYTRRPVRIPVRTMRKPTRLSASVATTIDVQPETIEVVTLLDYNVEFAGIDTFRFLVPASAADSVQIEVADSGPGSAAIQQKTSEVAENGWTAWTVVMQRKVLGRQRFRVSYRLTSPAAAESAAGANAAAGAAPAGPQEQSISLVRAAGKPATPDGAAAIGLTQLRGEVRVLKDRSLAVSSTASGGDVEPIDIRELTLLSQDGTAAYRYFRQPDDSAIDVQVTRTKYAIHEVAPTVVERGLVEIATGRHAAATFRCRYRIKTVERQRLRIDLPKDLDLLGVFIDGVEEKLNPLEEAKTAEDLTAFTVNISRRKRSDESFVLTIQFNWNVNPPPFEAPFGRGTITFPLPRIGGAEHPAQVQQLRTVVYVPEAYWLVGTPDRFSISGERDVRAALFESPRPYLPVSGNGFDETTSAPLDFPTTGLVATAYDNLGGAPQIEVVWWSVVKMTVLLSVAVALFGFILLRTSWENKIGLLLLLVFAAMLFGVKDRDALAHGLAAARLGAVFLVLMWLVHAVLGRSHDTAALAAAGEGVGGASSPSAAAPAETPAGSVEARADSEEPATGSSSDQPPRIE